MIPNSGQGDPLGIVQETEICTYEQMVYAQPRIRRDFEIQTDYRTPARRPEFVIVKKRKKKREREWEREREGERTCRVLNFAISVDHRVKIKGSEKRDKNLDLVTE